MPARHLTSRQCTCLRFFSHFYSHFACEMVKSLKYDETSRTTPKNQYLSMLNDYEISMRMRAFNEKITICFNSTIRVAKVNVNALSSLSLCCDYFFLRSHLQRMESFFAL